MPSHDERTRTSCPLTRRHVRTLTSGSKGCTDDWANLSGCPAVEEKYPAHGREDPCDDGGLRNEASDHTAGGAVESHAARLGELLQCRHDPRRLSCARQLHGGAVTSVAAAQAQS